MTTTEIGSEQYATCGYCHDSMLKAFPPERAGKPGDLYICYHCVQQGVTPHTIGRQHESAEQERSVFVALGFPPFPRSSNPIQYEAESTSDERLWAVRVLIDPSADAELVRELLRRVADTYGEQRAAMFTEDNEGRMQPAV